jgi:hypothetical protein
MKLSKWTVAVMFTGAQIVGCAFLGFHSVLFQFRWMGFVLLLPASALMMLFRFPEGPTINIAGRIEFEIGAPVLFLVNAAFWIVMT